MAFVVLTPEVDILCLYLKCSRPIMDYVLVPMIQNNRIAASTIIRYFDLEVSVAVYQVFTSDRGYVHPF